MPRPVHALAPVERPLMLGVCATVPIINVAADAVADTIWALFYELIVTDNTHPEGDR